MRKIFATTTLLTVITLLFTQCKKTDNFQSAELDDYLNLGVGKYVIYRMDSTLFSDFGQITTIKSYQAKDEIDAAITDNLGRPAWRVVRYIRDTLGLGPWQTSSTYMIVPTREVVEVIEENFRYQKLKLPIKEGFNWKGNTFISLYSNDPGWDYRYLDDWDYTYENVDQPFIVTGNQVVDNSVTVNQRDELIGIPTDINSYSERNFSVEVYGENIGLIYKDFLHWEYQPPNAGNPGYKIGYGLKLNMISHN
ncbi:MAG TPA: hypothetical protein VJT83_02515 [Chitinophagaceae bacterium]|nr:hypothetical protein [Chitinophagaceae bacterium]